MTRSQQISIEDFLSLIIKTPPLDKKELEKLKKEYKCVENNLVLLALYNKGIEEGKYKPQKKIFDLLRKQQTRSLSGITAITLLMKAWPCQGRCVYCPTEARMPKSYLSGEPGVMRAILNKWDAKKQVYTRIKALQAMGHDTSKNELIVLGGTWDNYPREYQHEFIQRMYEGLNEMPAKNITEAQNQNEKAKNRCIGLSLETRPDCVTEKSIQNMRFLGVTKVELGVQSVFDDVLKLTKRDHLSTEVKEATKLLKDAGFKIHYHMMPNLPGSTLEKDREMFEILFSDEGFFPDMLKIYPCVVLKNSELYLWFQQGKFTTYSDKEVVNLLADIKKKIPRFCRIMRVGRDIPAYEINNGNTITNIREKVHMKMKQDGFTCACIRCREIGFQKGLEKEAVLKISFYEANQGHEYFIEFCHPETDSILGFTRLRIPSQYFSKEKHFLSELEGAALIRELHVYGSVSKLGEKEKDKTQHHGFGKKLLEKAEHIVKEKYNIQKLAVISGIGVRDYYRKQGFELQGTYMVKEF